MPVGIIIRLLVIAAVAGGAFYAGWDWQGSRCAAEREKAINQAVETAVAKLNLERDRAFEIAKRLEKELEASRTFNRKLEKELESEISARDFSECVVPPVIVQHLHAATRSRRDTASTERDQ